MAVVMCANFLHALIYFSIDSTFINAILHVDVFLTCV